MVDIRVRMRPKIIDMTTQRWLDINDIRYVTANGDEDGYQKILNNIISIVKTKD